MGVPGSPKTAVSGASEGSVLGFGTVSEGSEGSETVAQGVSFGVRERNPVGFEPPTEVAGGVSGTPLNCISATSQKVSIGGSRSNRKRGKKNVLRS